MKAITMTFVATVAALMGSSESVQATETDDHIVAAFKTSYVYMQYLKDEPTTISAKDGVVTLTRTVRNDAHKRWPKISLRRCQE